MARRKNEMEGPVYYTTVQIAKMMGVKAPTVINWIDDGLIHAYRTPGGHRRISLDELVRFARLYNYPLSVIPDVDEVTLESTDRRVLVVDDEPDVCERFRHYLKTQGGFQVDVAYSGFSAGVAMARFKPSLVIMDIFMPDMDGLDMLKVIREDPEMQKIPVIACTTANEQQLAQRFQEGDFQGYIAKPLKLDHLQDMIASAFKTAGQ